MASFVEASPQAHLKLYQESATESFKVVPHRLAAMLQRLAGLWASGTRMTQNFYTYKPQYQGKEDRYGFWL